MCKAFSCLITRRGRVIWKLGTDSHSDLVEEFDMKDTSKDNPTFARVEITPRNNNYIHPDKWVLEVDEQIKPKWWHEKHKIKCFKAHSEWLKKLDKVLIKKEIIHPFKDVQNELTDEDKELLKTWASVVESFWDSFRDSIGASVWASVVDSIVDSVGASVWASVKASFWAYTGSFFNIPRKDWKNTENIDCDNYPFESVVKLWERGFVPSFDGERWRLHCGPDAKIVFEISQAELRKKE